MNKIDNVLQVIETILSSQKEEDCRKNISETLEILYKEFPEEKYNIKQRFDKMCKKYKKDFLKEIRLD